MISLLVTVDEMLDNCYFPVVDYSFFLCFGVEKKTYALCYLVLQSVDAFSQADVTMTSKYTNFCAKFVRPCKLTTGNVVS